MIYSFDYNIYLVDKIINIHTFQNKIDPTIGSDYPTLNL